MDRSESLPIDLMSLADIGHPNKLAREIHAQLRAQFGAVPIPIPLIPLAHAVGIETVVDHQTDAFEGALLVKGNKGSIILRSGMPIGRRNFTIGHELGHFLNPWHRSAKSGGECNGADLDKRFQIRAAPTSLDPSERREVEANDFSATLLMPAQEYRLRRSGLGKDCDVSQVRTLAEEFAVSHEAMARCYVDSSAETVAVLISQNGIIKKIIASDRFPYMGLRKGSAIPTRSITASFSRGKSLNPVSPLDEVDTGTWIERPGHVSSLFEQAMIRTDGWATTLLVAEEAELEDE